VVGIYHSAVEAFLEVDRKEVDVLFLDIQMPKILGLEMLKMLKRPPLTVITTAHREYAFDGFELEVVDYLMKPISLKRFLKTISRLKKHLQFANGTTPGLPSESDESPPPFAEKKTSTHIFVKTNRAYQKIELASILHIEAIKNHIKIVTRTETHMSLTPLSEFEKRLPQTFLRVHRSFIVSKPNILKFDHYSIQNEKGEIPIGRTYKEQALQILRAWIEE
ncbi:MAG: LytTR family DNA-binding domain-containing protein, partial [Bacteroidota bacterium]